MTFFAIICSIWLMQNEMVFNGKVFDSRLFCDIILLCVANWLKAKWPDSAESTLDIVRFPNFAKQPVKLKVVKKGLVWEPPSIDSLKFNINRSFKGNLGPSGIGGVLRDTKAAIKLVFSKAIGLADSNVAELLAVKEALRLFIGLKWASSHRLIIECDSSNVVKWVLNPMCSPWKLRKFMSYIKAFKIQLFRWDTVPILRMINETIDALAKSGVTRQCDLLLHYE
ncbi:hypothetical protein CRYUN_Cryun03dG0130500 [Craigia yunnanensis]